MKPLELMKDVGVSALKFGSKNSHIIMGVLAVGGLVGSVVLSYKMRPKVDEIMEEQRTKMEDLEHTEDMTEEEKETERKAITRETVKRLIRVGLPMGLCTILTGVSMIGSIVSSNNKIKSSTNLAIASDIASKAIYEKSKEIVGEEKTEEIKKAVDQEVAEKRFADIPDVDIENLEFRTYGGSDWYFDACTGRIFQCDDDTIINAATKLERDLNSGRERYIEYGGDFYYEIGVKGGIFNIPYAWMEGQRIEPNLNNTVKIGKKSVTILDWIDRPYDMDTVKKALRG